MGLDPAIQLVSSKDRMGRRFSALLKQSCRLDGRVTRKAVSTNG